MIAEGLRRYEASKNIASLPAEIRSTILSIAVRHGGPGVIQKLLATYPNEVADIQLDITSALSSTRDPAQAKIIYKQALGPKGFVRNQDLMRWIAVFMRNHYIRDFTWEWLTSNWEWVESCLGESKSYDYIPVYCASNFTTAKWQASYHAFFEPLTKDKRLNRNIMVGSADIAARVGWRDREESAITAWLASKNL